MVWAGYATRQHSMQVSTTGLPDLYEASISELQDGMQKGLFTSVDLVKAYLARIDEVNTKGANLRAIIELNPSALAQAAELDSERRTKGPRGPLHGIPIILKDNIATLHSEGMNTTSGSFALLNSIVPRDAHVSAKLRAAGAILLAKANLSEWANFRGDVPSGFSGRGGQANSPYVPLGDASGSSTGSGIATAIGLAAAAIGTETDGSIVFPASVNNLVGIKPTVGLTSRDGVIPISEHMDSVGPMTRSVADAAAILSVIAGRDPRDNHTLAQPSFVPDYTRALNPNALYLRRFGVPRKFLADWREFNPEVEAAFNASLETMRQMGATIVDPADLPSFEEYAQSARANQFTVMTVDFKVGINRYISELLEVPTGVKNLADLIEFNKAHADKELIPPYWEDQSLFIKVQNTTVDVEAYHAALAANKDIAATRGIDATLFQFALDALLLPTEMASGPAAIAGYPLITVPLGFLPSNENLPPAEPTREYGPNQPYGLSFLGAAWSEYSLIAYAYAFEQKTRTRLRMKAFEQAVPKTQLQNVME